MFRLVGVGSSQEGLLWCWLHPCFLFCCCVLYAPCVGGGLFFTATLSRCVLLTPNAVCPVQLCH
jgi:hypothetical protein